LRGGVSWCAGAAGTAAPAAPARRPLAGGWRQRAAAAAAGARAVPHGATAAALRGIESC